MTMDGSFFICKTPIDYLYLNAGRGTPCAGLVRAIPDLNSFLKADKSTIDENFGLENRIGSSKNTKDKALKVAQIIFVLGILLIFHQIKVFFQHIQTLYDRIFALRRASNI